MLVLRSTMLAAAILLLAAAPARPPIVLVSELARLSPAVAVELQSDLERIFGVPVAYEWVDEAHRTDRATLRRVCRNRGANAVAYVSTGSAMSFGGGEAPRYMYAFRLELRDCLGHVWRSYAAERWGDGSPGFYGGVRSAVVNQLRDEAAALSDAARNFASYGIYERADAADALFGLEPLTGTNASIVTWVHPMGSAARAGLRAGQIVASVSHTGSDYDVELAGAAPGSAHVRFAARNLAWYAAHPVNAAPARAAKSMQSNVRNAVQAHNAFRLAFIAMSETPDIAAMNAAIFQRLRPKLAKLYHAQLTYVEDGPEKACAQTGSIGTISITVMEPSILDVSGNTFGSGYGYAVLSGCDGHAYQQAGTAAYRLLGARASSQAVHGFIYAVVDQLFTRMEMQAAADPVAVANFLRYGIYLGGGRRDAFLRLRPDAGSASVEWLAPWGSAARAGLRKNAIVASINGTPTAGLSQDMLDELVERGIELGRLSLVVQNGTGSQRIDVEPQDAAWYASHAVAEAR